MTFKDNITSCAVTNEVVEAVMKAKNVTERGALFLLGFRLDMNLSSIVQKVRSLDCPHMLYEDKVFHGLLRNEVEYYTLPSGEVKLVVDKKGRPVYNNRPHWLQSVYEDNEVLQMKSLNKHNLVNILDFGNEWVEK